MSPILIPHPSKKRALILVDIQAGFLNEGNTWIVPNIQKVITLGEYACIVEAVFHAPAGSLWEKQVGWTFPPEPTIPEIKNILPDDTIVITKTTKSVWKGDVDLVTRLRERGIEEVHLAGLDTNDCVLASAMESFDLGFSTYVLEECTESSEGSEYRDAALTVLREIELTNQSELIKENTILS